jgi:hypothetical protein
LDVPTDSRPKKKNGEIETQAQATIRCCRINTEGKITGYYPAGHTKHSNRWLHLRQKNRIYGSPQEVVRVASLSGITSSQTTR